MTGDDNIQTTDPTELVPQKDWPTIVIAIEVSNSPESIRLAFALPPKAKKMIEEYLRDERKRCQENQVTSTAVDACKALFELIVKLAQQHLNDKKHIVTPFSKIIPFRPSET